MIIGQKKEPYKTTIYARIKVPIFKKIYMGYSKLYYALLNLRKVMIFVYLMWSFIMSLSSLIITLLQNVGAIH